jgi:PAS domain S-box-containing protein
MKILVIEDEHGSAYQAKQLLAGSDHPILNLEVVGALSTGLERLQNGGVDAVLLDLNLPDSSGAETFQRVRNCAPDIPIVLLNDGQITQAVPKKGLNGHGPALKQALNLARERSQLMIHASYGIPLPKSLDPYGPISDLISDYAYSFHIDKDGTTNIDWVTESFQRITGYDADELLKLGGWQALAHPDDLHILKEQHDKAFKGDSNSREFRIITKSGETRWVRHHSQYIWDGVEGRVAGFYGVGQDITERKNSEKLQHALLEISETANAARTLDDLYAAIHKIISGLIPAHNFYIALYDSVANLIHFPYFVDETDSAPQSKVPNGGLTEYVLRTGKPLLALPDVFDELVASGEVHLRGAPSVDWLGVPLKTSEDTVIGALVVQTYTEGVRYTPADRDLLAFVSAQVAQAIERKRSEQALRESEERYRTLIENFPIGVYCTTPGPKGQFLMANPAFLRMIGANSEDELLQYNVSDFYVNPVDRTTFSERLIRAGRINGAELHMKRRDGTRIWGLVTSQVEYDLDTGEVLFFNNTIEDITERKQREREQNAIVAVASALRNALTREQTLTIILDQVILLLEAETALIATCTDTCSEVVLELARGMNAASLTGLHTQPAESITGRVIASGQSYLNNEADQAAMQMLGDLIPGVRAVASVPLVIEGKSIGALTIGSKNEIAQVEFRMLAAIADLAASAIHRMTLYEETQLRLQRLNSLGTINSAISSSMDLRLTLKVLVDQIIIQEQADAADVLLLDPHTLMLDYAAGHGFRYRTAERTRLRLGEPQAGIAALERRPVEIHDLNAVELPNREPLLQEGFTAYYAVPLIAKGQVKGVLETFHRKTPIQDPDWRKFLEELGRQAAIAIDNAEQHEKIQRSNEELTLAYDATIEGWSYALDLRDKETEGHSQRVAEWTVRLARAMDVGPQELVHIRRGALLHDIGKVGLPDKILRKTGPLDEDEWRVMRHHPIHAHGLISSITFLRPALDIPYCHHEKWDGTGYPRGLKSDEIPLAARIFAIIDVWDALTSKRSYREAWTQEEALIYIAEQSGKHFDPRVVVEFFKLLESGDFSTTGD